MTKKEKYLAIRESVVATEFSADGLTNEDVLEFIDHEIELLEKKISKDSKAKKEADERAERLYLALAEMDKPVTITELKELTSDTEVAGWNTQRISALYRKLGDRISSEMVKGKRYFAVA